MRYWAWLITITACVGLTAYAEESEKVTLIQKYPAGAYVMTIDTLSQESISVSSQPTVSIRVGFSLVTEIAADEPNADGQRVRVIYRRLRAESASENRKVAFDSDTMDPGDPNTGAIGLYLLVIDHPIDVYLDSEGRAKKVSGLDEIFREAERQYSARQKIPVEMKRMIEESVKDGFANARAALPRDPVGVGGKWKVENVRDIPGVGQVKTVQAFRLAEIRKTPQGRVAVIEWDATGTLSADPADNAAPDTKIINPDIRKASGRVLMNVESGLVTEFKNDLAGNVEIEKGQVRRHIQTSQKSSGTVVPGRYVSSRPVTSQPVTSRPASRPASRPISSSRPVTRPATTLPTPTTRSSLGLEPATRPMSASMDATQPSNGPATRPTYTPTANGAVIGPILYTFFALVFLIGAGNFIYWWFYKRKNQGGWY